MRSRFAIEIETCAAGLVPCHAHDDVHACLILNGSMIDRLYDADERPHLKGDICLNPAGSDHWIEADAEGLHCAVVSWKGKANALERRRVDSEVAGLTVNDLDSGNPARAMIARQEVGAFVQSRLEGSDPVTPRWLQDVRDEVAKAGASDPVSSAARNACLHRGTLTRIFTNAYGLSPDQFRKMKMLERVSDMISAGVSLSHAAQEAGFADQPHMTRTWRRYLGSTPKLWLRSQLLKTRATIVQ